MRLIDAEPLEGLLHSRCAQCSNDYGSLAGSISGCLKLVQAQPTIAPPPNAPLTLEELREMDGEPVWCEILIKSAKPSCYAIIHDGVATGFVKGKRISLGCDKIGGYGLAWFAYRRRPEDGTEDAGSQM